MHMDPGAAVVSQPLSAGARKSRVGNWFFTGLAIAAAVTVFAGFARTYYLKTAFPTPSFPLLFHVHGAVFTAWMLLLVFQAWLVATRRTALHRRVGWIGLSLAVLTLVTGSLVSIAAARGQGPMSAAVARGEGTLIGPLLPPLEVMAINLPGILLFGVFGPEPSRSRWIACTSLAWERSADQPRRKVQPEICLAKRQPRRE